MRLVRTEEVVQAEEPADGAAPVPSVFRRRSSVLSNDVPREAKVGTRSCERARRVHDKVVDPKLSRSVLGNTGGIAIWLYPRGPAR